MPGRRVRWGRLSTGRRSTVWHAASFPAYRTSIGVAMLISMTLAMPKTNRQPQYVVRWDPPPDERAILEAFEIILRERMREFDRGLDGTRTTAMLKSEQ